MSRVLDLWAGMTGTVLDFAGTTAPAGWLMCFGQSVLRTDYPNLFAAIGTTYGSVDGTHFTLPDCRGRVIAAKDDMGGTAANRLQVSTTASTTNASANITVTSATGLAVNMTATGAGIPAGATITAISGTTVTLSANATATAAGVAVRFSRVGDAQSVGAAGGNQTHTQIVNEIPSHNHGGASGAAGTHNHYSASGYNLGSNPAQIAASGSSVNAVNGTEPTNTAPDHTHTIASQGGGQAMNNVQPTLVLNKIIKT